MDEFEWFVGIDWGTATHRVAVLDNTGKVVDEFNATHDGDGLTGMAERLLLGRNAERIAVSIETRWNAAAETLLDRGIRVFAINPKQLDRFRDRFTTAGAKDDRRDAIVCGDSLRTDRRAFREVTVGDPRFIELRELSRMHDELAATHRALLNRLYQQVLRIEPHILELGSLSKEWIVALIEYAPTPEDARTLKLTKIRTLLRSYQVRRWTAEEVQHRLLKRPPVVAPGVTAAAKRHIQLLLPQLSLVQSQLRDTRQEMQDLLEELAQPSGDPNKKEHRDVVVLRSLPGVGVIVAATMLAEARDALAERDYHRLRLICGTAPVTKQSGKSRLVSSRRACSQRLRAAMYHLAHTLVLHDARSKALYNAHRARGHTRGHALRVVADRALSLLVGMLRSDTEYDPLRRVA